MPLLPPLTVNYHSRTNIIITIFRECFYTTEKSTIAVFFSYPSSELTNKNKRKYSNSKYISLHEVKNPKERAVRRRTDETLLPGPGDAEWCLKPIHYEWGSPLPDTGQHRSPRRPGSFLGQGTAPLSHGSALVPGHGSPRTLTHHQPSPPCRGAVLHLAAPEEDAGRAGQERGDPLPGNR